MQTLRSTVLRLVALLLCFGNRAHAAEDIITWVRSKGGVVDLEIGAVNNEGLRGAKAVQGMQKGQIAIQLPVHLTVPLGDGLVTPEANAVFLLRQKRDDPEWNASMAPYWESLPSIGQSITKESMPTDALHLLQDPVLEASIVVRGALTKNVFDGGKPAIIQSFADDLPGVSLELFRHLTSVVASYAFKFLHEDGVPYRMMLPLLGVLNHRNEQAANVQVMQAANGDIQAYMQRDVRAGEELTYCYAAGIRRNDQSLFHYGFIQEQDPPALIERDLPGGNLHDISNYTEADYGFGGRLVTTKELQRLQGILRAFPTSASQDAALLQAPCLPFAIALGLHRCT